MSKPNGAFGDRLKAVLRNGNMSVSDLARWLGAPRLTVRGWVYDGFNPRGGPLDVADIHARLNALENQIRKNKGFPIPRLSPRDRIAYLENLRGGMKIT